MESHEYVQQVESVSRTERGAEFLCLTNKGRAIHIDVAACTPHIINFRLRPQSFSDAEQSLLEIQEEWPAAPVEVTETTEEVTVDSGEMRVIVNKNPWQYRVENSAGDVLLSEHTRDMDAHSNLRSLPLGVTVSDDAVQSCNETFAWTPGEAIYGFGEKFTRLNKVGQSIVGWNKNPYGAGTEEAYKNIPFFLSTRGYGVFVNTTFPASYHVASKSLAAVNIEIEHPLLDMYIIHGPTMKETLNRYASITGFAPLPPLKSFGIWHTPQPWFGKTAQQTADIAREFHARDIPIDYFMTVTLCSGSMEDSVEWTRDVSQALEPLGVKAGIYLAPMLNLGTQMEREARANGYALMNADGEPYEIPLGFRTEEGERGEAEYSLSVLTRDDAWRDRHNRIFYAPCLMPDFTNPDAVRWWKEKIQEHLQAGAYAVAMSDFGEDVPIDAVYHNGRSGLEMHNIYTLLYQKATFEAVEEGTDHRGLVNARSGTAGMQRYPICWSGDPNCTWEDILADLRAGLSIGLSGVPFWCCDNGGYAADTGDLSEELWMRWSQWSMFQSHVRLHAIEPPRVAWLFGERATDNFRKYAKLRYRLLPYIYAQAYHATQTGLPLMRAMVLEYEDDPLTYDIEDQYMFGDAFLVAPVYSPTDRRTVYLPNGKWYDYWTGVEYYGPELLPVHPELDVLPLYVRSDSIIAMGPDMHYIGERAADPITLDIWLDDAAECVLYDESNDQVELVTCNAERQENEIALEVSATTKRIIAKFNRAEWPVEMALNGSPVPRVMSKAELDGSATAWFYDGQSTLYVTFGGSDDNNLLTLQYETTE